MRNGLAAPALADAIFAQTRKFGAYYVLEKGIALLHAPADPQYAFGVGVSVLVCRNAVVFNGQAEKTARIIFTIVTPDNSGHIALIEKFGTYFADDVWKAKLLQCADFAEFNVLIKQKE